MLAKRIIPCLDVRDGRVVKGTHFVNLVDAGDPVEAAIRYDAEDADELVFLDISLAGVALIFGQDTPPPHADVELTSPLDVTPRRSERPTAVMDHNTVDLRPDKNKPKEDPTDQ